MLVATYSPLRLFEVSMNHVSNLINALPLVDGLQT